MLTYKQVLKEMEKNDFVELFLTRKHRDPKENYSRQTPATLVLKTKDKPGSKSGFHP